MPQHSAKTIYTSHQSLWPRHTFLMSLHRREYAMSLSHFHRQWEYLSVLEATISVATENIYDSTTSMSRPFPCAADRSFCTRLRRINTDLCVAIVVDEWLPANHWWWRRWNNWFRTHSQFWKYSRIFVLNIRMVSYQVRQDLPDNWRQQCRTMCSECDQNIKLSLCWQFAGTENSIETIRHLQRIILNLSISKWFTGTDAIVMN